MLRSFILEEIKVLNECGCKDEVDDPVTLLPDFSSNEYESHPHFNMINDYGTTRESNALNSKCPGSYAKTADQLVVNPEFIASIIKLLMNKSGSTCPESSAKALNDIVNLYNF